MSGGASIKEPGLLFCWLSGATPSVRPENWGAPWGLEIAHIASGGGRARRVDDARAVVLLSSLAHRCHVSDSELHPTMNFCGKDYPTIDERHTLWIKRSVDPKRYDVDFLKTVWIGIPPDPVKPPNFWNEMFHMNTGVIR